MPVFPNPDTQTDVIANKFGHIKKREQSFMNSSHFLCTYSQGCYNSVFLFFILATKYVFPMKEALGVSK